METDINKKVTLKLLGLLTVVVLYIASCQKAPEQSSDNINSDTILDSLCLLDFEKTNRSFIENLCSLFSLIDEPCANWPDERIDSMLRVTIYDKYDSNYVYRIYKIGECSYYQRKIIGPQKFNLLYYWTEGEEMSYYSIMRSISSMNYNNTMNKLAHDFKSDIPKYLSKRLYIFETLSGESHKIFFQLDSLNSAQAKVLSEIVNN